MRAGVHGGSEARAEGGNLALDSGGAGQEAVSSPTKATILAIYPGSAAVPRRGGGGQSPGTTLSQWFATTPPRSTMMDCPARMNTILLEGLLGFGAAVVALAEAKGSFSFRQGSSSLRSGVGRIVGSEEQKREGTDGGGAYGEETLDVEAAAAGAGDTRLVGFWWDTSARECERTLTWVHSSARERQNEGDGRTMVHGWSTLDSYRVVDIYIYIFTCFDTWF
jgi:hypothetical protein